MISVNIYHGFKQEPAETFIEATTRFVRVPDVGLSLLAVTVDSPSHMQIEIDGRQVKSVALDPKRHTFPLAPILLKKRLVPSRNLLSLVLSGDKPQTKAEEPKAFTVTIREGGEDGPVTGTYNIQLQTDGEFDTSYNMYLHGRDTRGTPAQFTTDARSPHTCKGCWNCEATVEPGQICKNCGCDQDDHDEDPLDAK